MRLLVALVFCAAAAAASPAAADGFYFSEAYGGATVQGPLARYHLGGFHVRGAIGGRMGHWALEAWIAASLGDGNGDPFPASPGHSAYTPSPSSLTMSGFDVKYIQPIRPRRLELYVRGGLSSGESDPTGGLAGYSGRGARHGAGLGAGLVLKGKVSPLGLLFFPAFFLPYGPQITGALFVDAGYDQVRLHGKPDHGESDTVGGAISTVMIGWALGGDF